MRVLIAGCGYLGLHLGRELVAQGHSVVGLRRSAQGLAELATAGLEPHAADLAQPDFPMPQGPFDGVVFAASPGRTGGVEAYRATYVDGLRNLLGRLAASPPRRFVYTGSTSVYAQTDGSLVKESSPASATSPTAGILLEAEALLAAAARDRFPAVVLRLAGLYGPDRLHLLHRFIRNEVRIAGQGLRHLNMIHRDDAAGAVVTALTNGRPGEIYNVVDQEPVTEIHFYTWLAETLGKYAPTTGHKAEMGPDGAPPPNRKISNRRLTMELGCRLRHPTFRQGYTTEIKALTDAGLLDVPREER
jgi:nucleoside-diphosphate-sugar epimerase